MESPSMATAEYGGRPTSLNTTFPQGCGLASSTWVCFWRRAEVCRTTSSNLTE